MSSTTRRHVETSNRRVSVVAGVLLASAAIPFAAAGAVWGGQTSGTGVFGDRSYTCAGDSSGGTANVKDDPYVYNNRQSPDTDATQEA